MATTTRTAKPDPTGTRDTGLWVIDDLPAHCRDSWPGDTASVLDAPRRDENGTLWPVGTVYHPLDTGCDQRGPRCNGLRKRVSIGGREITFRIGGRTA